MNIKQLLNLSTDFLAKQGIASPRLDAEVMLADLLQMERINLYVKFDYPLKTGEINSYREMIKQRAQHVPVAYILGKKEFMSLDLIIKKGTLIPRPDTENLVETVLNYCKEDDLTEAQIIDVGTGSGAIAVSLAYYLESARVVGVDVSKIALQTASLNCEKFELNDRLKILKSDLLTEFIKREINGIDIIVANPPYLTAAEMEEISAEVKQEPELALLAGKDGLTYYRKLIPQSEKVLADGGHIFLEIGYQQAESVKALFSDDWQQIEVIKDYAEHDRIIKAVYVP